MSVSERERKKSVEECLVYERERGERGERERERKRETETERENKYRKTRIRCLLYHSRKGFS